jgi:prenyltransferase beta subunit
LAAKPLAGTLERAVAWHFREPILVDRPGASEDGAVLHGIDTRGPKALGIYTEITGYAVSLFTFLHARNGGGRFLDAATRAADYLVRIQSPEGGYPHLPQHEAGTPSPPLYAFDTSMCIVGLLRLHRITGDRRHLESALAAGRWLLSMQRPDGSFAAMWERDRGSTDPGSFFGDGSCIHAKNAMALLDLHAATGQEEMRSAARRACDHALTLQDGDGSFWATPERTLVFTHAHAYACEGLLYAGERLGEERYKEAVRRGVAWLVSAQRRDGGWDAGYKQQVLRAVVARAVRRSAPTDAAAQGARLLQLVTPSDQSRWQAALQFLASCQHPQGGFFYAKTRFGYSPFLYTFCAQFAVQALTWRNTDPSVEDLF